MKFDLAEIPRLLTDSTVASFSRAAVDAIFVSSARPLTTALEEAPADRADLSPLRAAAFASSMQGLSCRLARLPDLSTLPEALSEHILSEAERTTARGLRIVELLRDVLALLTSAGAEVVPLKGAALILRGDVEPSLRPMGDLDLLLLDSSRISMAAETLERKTHYRRLFSTPRHLVLGEKEERVPYPAMEDPGNPLRIELHRCFRLRVLGVHLDATEDLKRLAERSSAGALILPRDVMFRHLWHHAAEDFAARGLRGIQAIDFLDMARRDGPVAVALDRRDARGAAPLLYVTDGIERVFPGTFDRASLVGLSWRVPRALRERAWQLSILRHTRSTRGWTKTCLTLAPGMISKARFLARTAFPTLGEVKANFAPGASGLRLALAWFRVLVRRARGLLP